MRINKYIAQATGIGRRPADAAIAAGQVTVNGAPAQPGQDITPSDVVTLNGKQLVTQQLTGASYVTLLLNKPAGYVVSRSGQGSQTVYDLLPAEYHHLKPVGRLDKDSSGLILLTNDGQLAFDLTHPSRQKLKVYEVSLNKPLQPLHRQMITEYGVALEDGPSRFQVERIDDHNDTHWRILMSEGRNRQIRRTFASLGYTVIRLHRTSFGRYSLGSMQPGQWVITR